MLLASNYFVCTLGRSSLVAVQVEVDGLAVSNEHTVTWWNKELTKCGAWVEKHIYIYIDLLMVKWNHGEKLGQMFQHMMHPL